MAADRRHVALLEPLNPSGVASRIYDVYSLSYGSVLQFKGFSSWGMAEIYFANTIFVGDSTRCRVNYIHSISR